MRITIACSKIEKQKQKQNKKQTKKKRILMLINTVTHQRENLTE